MTNTQDIKQLVALESCIKITKVEEVKINNKKVKLIYVLSSKARVRCPKCNKYTYSVHDKLKPIRVKYLDMAGYTTYLEITKRRFRCKECNKIFTENNYINNPGKKISIKLEQKILLDLRD